jgi:hypothetical protein
MIDPVGVRQPIQRRRGDCGSLYGLNPPIVMFRAIGLKLRGRRSKSRAQSKVLGRVFEPEADFGNFLELERKEGLADWKLLRGWGPVTGECCDCGQDYQ